MSEAKKEKRIRVPLRLPPYKNTILEGAADTTGQSKQSIAEDALDMTLGIAGDEERVRIEAANKAAEPHVREWKAGIALADELLKAKKKRPKGNK